MNAKPSCLSSIGAILQVQTDTHYLCVMPVRLTLSLLLCCRDRRLLQPAQVCDILKGILLVICYFMMHYVDYSMMYHLIRGQSVIKLYIIYNMLEVRTGLAVLHPNRQSSWLWVVCTVT